MDHNERLRNRVIFEKFRGGGFKILKADEMILQIFNKSSGKRLETIQEYSEKPTVRAFEHETKFANTISSTSGSYAADLHDVGAPGANRLVLAAFL